MPNYFAVSLACRQPSSCLCISDRLSLLLFRVMCCPVLQSYREGLQLLCQAYDSDPRNPAVLNLLAHYCLTRKEYAKVGFAGTHAKYCMDLFRQHTWHSTAQHAFLNFGVF